MYIPVQTWTFNQQRYLKIVRLLMREAFVVGSTLNASFWLFETTSANFNLKPLKVIVNHIVDESLQDFQAWAEDVKSVGKPIFACWPG